ncbi:serine/threonine protein kinase [Actinospica durhamensis]|uniref:non-specific serine/threonine protein kinase n=1 Tax=Actinospica durhamensis TaxID=1508375 RepID=A0A941EL51_9ACTN|nr:serine/threonine-protein kinase [Actinospica durhamensis]MBR7832900.1 serine/threonine protein kinase [Actinospica durhamensis]
MSEVGQVVAGRYRLLRVLGAGGMGRVWQARDTALEVDVAVKEVHLEPGIAAPERAQLLSRAQREARNAAQLRDHPNVVAVYDVVIEDEHPWIVMRLIHGTSLAELLARHGALPADLAVQAARSLLEALSAAHKVGIVHRDVKPANVLLTEDGRVLLTDFGIAKRSGDTAMTGTGWFIGSIEYMAPERMRGEQDQPAGDLFSLGATLYHVVTGHSPFRRESPAASMSAVLTGAPQAPAPGLPLAGLIMALLAKNPAERPSAAQALALLAAPGTVLAPQQRQRPQVPSRPTPPVTGVVGVGPTVTAAAPVPTRLARTIKAYKGIAVALAFAPDARTLAVAGTDGTVRLWDPGSGALINTLTGSRDQVRCVAYSPDGTRLAAGGQDAIVRLWNPANARQSTKHVLLTGHARAVTALAFSPDSKVLASGGADGAVRLWDARTGVLIRELTDRFGEVYAVSFAPDGVSVAATGSGRGLLSWDVKTGTRLRHVRFEDADLTCFAHGPAGELIVGHQRDGRHYLAALRPGHPPTALTGLVRDLCCSRLSPDRRTVVTGGTLGGVQLWTAATHGLLAKLDAHRDAKHPSSVLDAALSAGNTLLAISGGERLWIYERPS